MQRRIASIGRAALDRNRDPADLDFQLLFEELPDVALVLLPDAPRYTMVAATRARLLATHTTREQTLGRGLFEIFPDNPDDPAATGTSNLRASLERVLATRAADTMAVQKYDIRGPDGTFEAKYWSPRNLPVLSSSGEVVYILHCVEDVTELVRASELGDELRDRTRAMEREVISRSRELASANRDLRDANVRLGELDAAKTAFFSNVSHEFRTPLTLMLGPIEDSLADTGDPLPPRQRARLQLAHDNSLRLLKLVNALLDFSRVEAGRLRARYAPLDVGQFSAQLAGMFHSAADRAGIDLVIECQRQIEPTWVDRDMWEKIVLNLISNAFKFTHRGQIVVRVREESTRVVLEVSDTGIGIPEAEQARIFERFHRVVGAAGRTQEGSGIGLSLVRQLVDLHGGKVTVESVVDAGTTFRVEMSKGFAHLPGDAVSQTAAEDHTGRDTAAHAAEARRWAAGTAVATRAPVAVAATAGAPRPRVLIVDDNADLREYISGLLAPTYDLSIACDGLAALAELREHMPDLVVSDVMMPRLDGFGLIRELRADPSTAALPVILMSARAGEESAIAGLDAGCDDYLIKPFSARELLARVRTHVEMARVRRSWIATLQEQNRRIQETTRQKSEFLANMSHELRTPLTAIIGFAELLYDGHVDPARVEYREFLGDILTSGRHLVRLINDILDLSRVEAGKLELRPEDVDLAALVGEVVSLLRPMAANKRIRVDAAVDPSLTDIVLDPSRLKQVLFNYVSNAVKFTPQGGSVTVAARPQGEGRLRLEVTDTGIGIAPADVGRLFVEFQQLEAGKRSTKHVGTGLGLAFTKRLVESQGGEVGVDSVTGSGSTFYAVLPRRLGR